MTQAPGEEVAVELATGQRPAGTIDWVAGGEAGIRFKQPIDMLALLNRKLVSQPGERRTMPRVELRCGVGIKWGINLAAATLRNISARGLQVEGDGLPPQGHLRFAVHRRPERAGRRGGVEQGQSGRHRVDATN